MLSVCRGNIENNFNEIINKIELEDYKKTILRKRYLDQVILYDKKSKTAEFFYIFFSLFVTIGSIILPALLSIQQLDYSEDDNVDDLYRRRVYWTTWGLSLLVSIFNGILQLFSLNKQYISYNTTREKLISEGWQYFQLSGNYEDTTHEESFTNFCDEIEKIKSTQVDKDFLFINSKTIQNKKGKKHYSTTSTTSTTVGLGTIYPEVIKNEEDSSLLNIKSNNSRKREEII